MNQTNLFAHFAQRSGTPERHATDALHLILSHSSTAREALHKFCKQQGVDLPEKLHFESQVLCSDGSIPDIAGFDQQGRRVVFLEGKFFAVLTDHQPVSYLKNLAPDVPSLLAFVAPGERVGRLWNELLMRCREASVSIHPSSAPLATDTYCIGLVEGTSTALGVFSWRQLLNSLNVALKEAGEFAVAADVQQLQGLCEAMDESAFVPLRAEELDPSHGIRLHQYGLLIGRIFEELQQSATPWLTSLGRYSADLGSFGRYFQMHSISSWMGISGLHWASMRPTPEVATPVWIEFYADRQQIRRLRQQLRQMPYDEETKLRSFEDPTTGPNISVAIDLMIGVDEQRLVRSIVDQLNEIAAFISSPV